MPSKSLLSRLTHHAGFIIFLTIFGPLLSLNLDKIPLGFFCDEAVIGVITNHFLSGDWSDFINPFLYRSFHYAYPPLPIYATLPFIALFGLTETAVRFTSVAFAIGSIIILYLIFRQITNRPLLAITAVAITPIFLHLSRVAFGQLPALFFIILSYYLYLQTKPVYAILSGLAMGISAYGNSHFLIISPLIVGCIGLSELLQHRLNLSRYHLYTRFLITFLIIFSPIIYNLIRHPEALNRIHDKTQAQNLTLAQRIPTAIQNYPKYFTPHFLFLKGESELAGAYVTRHSVPGHGVLSLLALPLIISAYLLINHHLNTRQPLRRAILPFFFLFPLYPLPDLLTTTLKQPPYAVSTFPTLFLSSAFLSVFAISHLTNIKSTLLKKTIIIAISLIISIEALRFTANYYLYPMYSSDYWGWQWGPKDIIAYFQKHQSQYDQLYMTGYFNEPAIFLDFYDPNHTCTKCTIGSLHAYNPQLKQLFAIRSSELNSPEFAQYQSRFLVRHALHLPNGHPEYLIGEIAP